MSRKAREKSPTGIYHVLVTGIDRQNLFLDDQDKRKYLALLEEYQTVCAFDLYAYCLLDNHIHLLFSERDGDISRIMKRLGTSYVYWFNNRYQRTGKLFEDRFKSESVVSEDQFRAAVRFIHSDPVRCVRVNQPQDYEFSSYRGYFEGTLIQKDMAERVFGGKEAFTRFHEEKGSDRCLDLARKDKVLTDEELCAVIHKEYGVLPKDLVTLPREKVAAVAVQLLKSYRVSVRQLGRVTGISMSTVWRMVTKTSGGASRGKGEV